MIARSLTTKIILFVAVFFFPLWCSCSLSVRRALQYVGKFLAGMRTERRGWGGEVREGNVFLR